MQIIHSEKHNSVWPLSEGMTNPTYSFQEPRCTSVCTILIVMAVFMYGLGRVMVPSYVVKHYTRHFSEGIFAWDGQINWHILSKVHFLHYPISQGWNSTKGWSKQDFAAKGLWTPSSKREFCSWWDLTWATWTFCVSSSQLVHLSGFPASVITWNNSLKSISLCIWHSSLFLWGPWSPHWNLWCVFLFNNYFVGTSMCQVTF